MINVNLLSNRDKVMSFLITFHLGTKSLITTSFCAAAVCGHFIISLYTVDGKLNKNSCYTSSPELAEKTPDSVLIELKPVFACTAAGT